VLEEEPNHHGGIPVCRELGERVTKRLLPHLHELHEFFIRDGSSIEQHLSVTRSVAAPAPAMAHIGDMGRGLMRI